MKLAWKEIKHNKTKFLLIESILCLMMFMVIFLSGLANGLARAVSASIENSDAAYFIINEDAENLITISSIDSEALAKVAAATTDSVTGLDIQRMNLYAEGTDTKLDVTYFAIDPEGFLTPSVTQGSQLTENDSEYTIVLDDSFLDENIGIGDFVEDANSGIKMKVVGFTKDEMYGHSAVGFISTNTYTAINQAINPAYQEKYHAIAVEGSDVAGIDIEGLSVVAKADIVKSIPGYSAEQTTINMILWVLVVVSAAILGVFFYVITIQKLKQYGLLKSIGMKMSEIAGMITGQVLMLACIGVVAGDLISFGMASLLPSSMPFYLQLPMVILISVSFIVISVVTSLLSTIKVAQVDPMIIIGGEEV